MGELADSVRSATEAMGWLGLSDQAAVRLALTYAEQIDQALETGDLEQVTKALYLGPHLLKTLGELGGTPAGRKALDIREETRGKLANLRAIRGGKDKPAAKSSRRSRSA